jgi:hypothetical protein
MQPPRVTFKLKYLLAFVAVVAIGLSLDSQRVAIWDGAFPLQLDLQDATGHAFVAVATKDPRQAPGSRVLPGSS